MAKYTVGLSCSLHIYFTSINFPVILLNALTTVAYYLFCTLGRSNAMTKNHSKHNHCIKYYSNHDSKVDILVKR